MISWMQKHNKYLVWTIWVATIAFIGAGFVGWGSYDLGGKAGSIAKVGNVEITQSKLNMVYSNIYDQYNRAMGGKLDEKKAKEMGLIKQAYNRLATQAKILNFAQDSGIIVSDKEVSSYIQGFRSFQKDGQFNKEIYTSYLNAQRLNAKVFESRLRDELMIKKTISLLGVDTLPLETEAISAAMNISDKLAYKVLTTDDVTVVSNDEKVKPFWEMQKERYMTKKMYNLSIVWTESKDVTVTDDEIKNYYEANSFNFTNAEGKQLTFEEAKEEASNGLKLKKTKKSAQKAYIAFKKGTLSENEKVTLALGDKKFTNEIWTALESKNIGDIVKPKIVGNMYTTIKIENIVEPTVKTYDEAKSQVTAVYTSQAKQEALTTLADETLKSFDKASAIITDFVKLEENVKLEALNNQESLQFLQKLFTSSKEKGIISVSDKVIIYDVLEQKLTESDENQTKTVNETVNTLKQSTFESNLIKMLDKKYPTETYVGGLTN